MHAKDFIQVVMPAAGTNCPRGPWGFHQEGSATVGKDGMWLSIHKGWTNDMAKFIP